MIADFAGAACTFVLEKLWPADDPQVEYAERIKPTKAKQWTSVTPSGFPASPQTSTPPPGVVAPRPDGAVSDRPGPFPPSAAGPVHQTPWRVEDRRRQSPLFPWALVDAAGQIRGYMFDEPTAQRVVDHANR